MIRSQLVRSASWQLLLIQESRLNFIIPLMRVEARPVRLDMDEECLGPQVPNAATS